MKKWWLTLLGAGVFVAAVFADNTVPIETDRLPQTARSFLEEYYGDVRIASATMDREHARSYEVMLFDGTTIEFDARGQWKEVKTSSGSVPASIVPVKVAEFVGNFRPGKRITGIEREGRDGRRGYDVWLDDGTELEFNRDLRLIGMDY